MASAALAATCAPLATYGLTLAIFGGAHVLAELRFVEARYARRMEDRVAQGVGLLLILVAALRLAKQAHLAGGTPATQLELLLVAGLAATTLPSLARRGRRPLAIGLVAVVAVGLGLALAPIWTMLGLACLHNWTPVGFLAEGLPAAERARGLRLGLLAFVAAPLAIATGLPTAALSAFDLAWPQLSLLPAGSLQSNFSAYLHPSLHERDWATAAFSALVFAQCMHYAAVIGVLPRLSPGGPYADSRLGLSRLSTRRFVALVGVLTAVGLVGYGMDFKVARGWYGVLAALHAWLELPVLLLALAPMAVSSRPKAQNPGKVHPPAA